MLCNTIINNNIYISGDTEKYGRKDGTFGKLMMPAKSFVEYISSLEQILMQNIRSVAIGKIGSHLFNLLQIVPFQHPCPNFPLEYLLKLFIRMRTFYIIKYANRNFRMETLKNKRTNRNKKLEILKHI